MHTIGTDFGFLIARQKMRFMRTMCVAILLVGLMFFYNTSNAQGWCQDRQGIYSVGAGGTSVIGLGPGYSGLTGPGLSVNISGEYRVQRFVGVGFETGMDVFMAPYYIYTGEPPYPRHYATIGIPLAIKCNVHILEAANLPIANRLDVYAGLNLGAGPAIYTGVPSGAFGFLEVGPQVGVRYWLNRGVAIFGEFGYGATFTNIGFTF
jgi:hypothetical protein